MHRKADFSVGIIMKIYTFNTILHSRSSLWLDWDSVRMCWMSSLCIPIQYVTWEIGDLQENIAHPKIRQIHSHNSYRFGGQTAPLINVINTYSLYRLKIMQISEVRYLKMKVQTTRILRWEISCRHKSCLLFSDFYIIGCINGNFNYKKMGDYESSICLLCFAVFII